MASANAIFTASILPSSSKQDGLKNRRVSQSLQQGQRMGQKQPRNRLVVKAEIGIDQQSTQSGIDKLANAVGLTLGPRGTNVASNEFTTTTARSIDQLSDLVVEEGGFIAFLIREVASKTSDDAGDGTTTASILALEMAKLGLLSITSGANAVAIKKGIDKTVQGLVDELQRKATPLKGRDDIKAIASIAAGNDEFIGTVIADAIDKVGSDGVLFIESSYSLDTTVVIEQRIAIDSGYLSPYFVTDPEKMIVHFENARVLVADQKISAMKDILPVLEQISKSQTPLLIIAEDVTGEALSTLVVNKIRGILHVAAVKAPGFGEGRKALLQDIAILTGAKYITSDLENTGIEQLGVARKITISKDSTALIIGDGTAASKDAVQSAIAQLKTQLSETAAERIARLSGGVAVKVGGATEDELQDRKLRVEDAKNAAFAAIEEGIVPGGGAALVHLSTYVPAIKDTLEDADEKTGADIVQKALTAPAALIAQNGGADGEAVVEKVRGGEWEFGYNALTDTFENLVEAGVIDPAKVTRIALQNAAWAAGMVLISSHLDESQL